MVDQGDQDAFACFGFRIRSSCPFRFLRRGGGGDVLDVVEASGPLSTADSNLLFEWTLRDPDAEVTARLYAANGWFHFWTSDAGWYRIDPRARRIEISDHGDALRREQRLWGLPTVLCVKERGDFALHAAAVEIDSGAILFAAPGRFGKTTLALACHAQGYRLLTEDTACCRVTGEPLLFPGPASVRLRPDTFDGHAPPGTTIADVRDDRVHLVLNPDRMGDGRPVPIKALVFLREAPDEIRLDPVKRQDALPDLWTLTFRFQDDDERKRAFSQLATLASAVPVWNLYRPLRLSRLNEVVAHLARVAG